MKSAFVLFKRFSLNLTVLNGTARIKIIATLLISVAFDVFSLVDGNQYNESLQGTHMEPAIGEYRHYSGKEYEVLYIAKHSETLEEMVVYKALYGDYQIWVRPRAMFIEEIVHNGVRQPRFRRIDETAV